MRVLIVGSGEEVRQDPLKQVHETRQVTCTLFNTRQTDRQ